MSVKTYVGVHFKINTRVLFTKNPSDFESKDQHLLVSVK